MGFTSGRKMKQEMDKQNHKVKLLIVYVLILTYCHELWVVTEKTRMRVQAAEMRFVRKVAGLIALETG